MTRRKILIRTSGTACSPFTVFTVIWSPATCHLQPRPPPLTPALFCGKLHPSTTRFRSTRKEPPEKRTSREAQRQDWERRKLRSLLQHASPYQATVSTVADAGGQATFPVDEVEVPRRRPGENREIGGCLQGHATALRFSSRQAAPQSRLATAGTTGACSGRLVHWYGGKLVEWYIGKLVRWDAPSRLHVTNLPSYHSTNLPMYQDTNLPRRKQPCVVS